MKRLLLRLIIALLTFTISSGLAILCGAYNARVSREQEAKQIENARVMSICAIPQSLAAELKRIDELYKERCRMPDESKTGWPAVRDLERFTACSDEWAKARHAAIDAAREEHLTRY